jgi:hypothetical protein
MSKKDKNPQITESFNMWMGSGMVGAFVSSLCCLTPLAVLGLSMAGLGYMTGYIDSFALPLFAISMGLIGYGWYSKTSLEKNGNGKCPRC